VRSTSLSLSACTHSFMVSCRPGPSAIDDQPPTTCGPQSSGLMLLAVLVLCSGSVEPSYSTRGGTALPVVFWPVLSYPLGCGCGYALCMTSVLSFPHLMKRLTSMKGHNLAGKVGPLRAVVIHGAIWMMPPCRPCAQSQRLALAWAWTWTWGAGLYAKQ
jgi:hypothetical protein